MDRIRIPERMKPNSSWSLVAVLPEYTAWQKGKFCALSSSIYVSDEHLPPHWEWLVSFSVMGKARVSNNEIKQLLKDFSAENFEEDNHEPGIARKFFLAVDHKYRIPCPCKNETIVTDGEYQYSKLKEQPHANT